MLQHTGHPGGILYWFSTLDQTL